MAHTQCREISRRDFIKTAGVGALGAGFGPFFLFPQRAQAQQKTLRILQWSHFVPGYDKWFDTVFTKQWGDNHDTKVIVDHISTTEVGARAGAEAAAKKGHDLLMFHYPPAPFEKQVIDHKEIYQEVERKHGKAIALAHRSTYNPRTKKYFAFSDSFGADPGNWRKDLWTEVGYPAGPDTYDDLRSGAKKIRDKFGNPCGLGLSQEIDSNMAMCAILWSFGGAEQDEYGNVTINSKATVEALKYMRALYQESQTPEVFTWDPSSNNRAMLAGKASFVINAISITRQAEKENPEMAKKIWLCRPLRGPVRRISPPNNVDCYVIWEFAENKEGAKQFLVDLIDNFAAAFKASDFYDFPCFPRSVPNLKEQLSQDPKADPHDKYKVLVDAPEWTTNLGYPGYATAAIGETFSIFLIPNMFAKAARGEMNAEDAAKAAEKELKRIFDKWR